MIVIAATQNKNKLDEISQITKDFGMGLLSQADAGLGHIVVDESGSTCEENSYLKAKAISDISGKPAIADDSGLFVDALGGAPGVNSARYSGIHGDDTAARRMILRQMEGLPYRKRTASFVCVITLVYPDGRVISAKGECKDTFWWSRRSSASRSHRIRRPFCRCGGLCRCNTCRSTACREWDKNPVPARDARRGS